MRALESGCRMRGAMRGAREQVGAKVALVLGSDGTQRSAARVTRAMAATQPMCWAAESDGCAGVREDSRRRRKAVLRVALAICRAR